MASRRTGNFSTGTGAAQFGFSRTGSLVYVAGLRTEERSLVWVDRKGAVEPLGAPPRAYRRPAISPDGRQIAVNIQGQTEDIWIYDIGRGTLTRLTFEGNNQRHVWMPDGRRIVFASSRLGTRGLFWKLADGTGTEEQITNDKLFQSVSSISPDGKLAILSLNPTEGENDIGTIELQGDRKISVFLKGPFDEGVATLSPDGRWLAYLSDESGRYEVYVRAFPGPEGKWQISTEGGFAPVWGRNGRELFYSSATEKLMVVDISAGPTFQAGTPRVLLEGQFQFRLGGLTPDYDVSPDGQRFLVVQGGDANLTQLNVVLNWFEELKKRVPSGQ
jgi:serine/threonine-protein kinase